MLSSRPGRLVGIIFLLVVLGGLCLGFGVQHSVVNPPLHPSADDLAYEYDGYVGEVVHVGGPVVDTDPVVIEAEYDYFVDGEQQTGILRLTIHDVSASVAVGEVLRTYAVVQQNNELTARNELVIPRWRYVYMYVVSGIAGLWVFGRLIQGWTVDRSDLVLHRGAPPDKLEGDS